MDNQTDHVKSMISELRRTVSEPILKKLNLNKCERVAEKLASFSSNCEDCQVQLLELENQLNLIKEDIETIDDTKIKLFQQSISHITSHLEKKHKLIQEGHYLAIYMSLGISLGVVFGLTIFDNIALGIPIGMCLGLAIGTGLDSDAKKKGKTI